MTDPTDPTEPTARPIPAEVAEAAHLAGMARHITRQARDAADAMFGPIPPDLGEQLADREAARLADLDPAGATTIQVRRS